ncbi:MAG: M2 family metallopeptidase, partial [Myxococcota bacterium]
MERNIVDFIEQFVSHAGDLERLANLAYWEFAADGSLENERKMAQARKDLLTVYSSRDHYARIRTYDTGQRIESESVARQIRLMKLQFAQHQMPPTVLERLVEQEAEGERIMNTFRARVNGTRISANAVTRVLVDSEDLDERQAVWEACKEVGAAVGPTLLRTVGIRNRAARDLNYRDYYDMSLELQEIDETSLFQLV